LEDTLLKAWATVDSKSEFQSELLIVLILLQHVPEVFSRGQELQLIAPLEEQDRPNSKFSTPELRLVAPQIRLLSRLASLLPLKIKTGSTRWTGLVDHELAGFGALVNNVVSSLQQAHEAQTVAVFNHFDTLFGAEATFDKTQLQALKTSFLGRFDKSEFIATSLGVAMQEVLIHGFTQLDGVKRQFPEAADLEQDLATVERFYIEVETLLKQCVPADSELLALFDQGRTMHA
jgi:hypothetical protein